MGEPAFQLPEEDRPDVRPNLRALEGGGEATEPRRGHLSAVNDDTTAASERKSLEEATGQASIDGHGPEFGPSALDDIRDTVGRGYRDDSPKNRLSRLLNKGSKRQRRIAIASTAGGGVTTIAIIIFFALIPLKIETLVTNLENHFGAATQQAMGDEMDNLFSRWVARDIMPNLVKGTCRSTASAGCVSVDRDTGPFGKLYNGWRQGKVEQKLATKYDIVIGRKGNNFYINFPNENASITESDARRLMDGKTDLFSLAEENSRNRNFKVSRSEIRSSLNDALKNETYWKRTYDRYQFGKLLEDKYGIRRCVVACDIRDKFTGKVEDKRLLAKSTFIQRVISPLSDNYAYMFQCVLQGGCDTKPSNNAGPGDSENLSPAQQQVKDNLDTARDKIAPEALEKLTEDSSKIAEKGISAYITETITTKFVSMFAGEAAGQAAGQNAADAVPVVGWVVLFSQILHAGENVGPTIQHLSYAINAAAAVQTFSMFSSFVSETHSGHMDATEAGSMNQAVSTNLTGSKDDRSDATQTPLYAQLNNENTAGTAGTQTSLLLSSAYADSSSTDNNNPAYHCNDGKPVPDGQVRCAEEQLDRGNGVATNISNGVKDYLKFYPGAQQIIDFVSAASSKVGSVLGDLLGATGGILNSLTGGLLGKATGAIGDLPGASQFKDFVAKAGVKTLNYAISKLNDSPFTDNMSGGRTYDMMAAGADVTYSESCQELLGCAKVSDQQAAAIQNNYLDQQKTAFQNQSLFARMFSTSTPYSLVSHLAVQVPGSLSATSSKLAASIIRNPVSGLTHMFGGFGLGSSEASLNAKDPFGVPQTAYISVPNNPDTYWAQNCVNGPMAKYDEATNQLDISDWLNSQPQDPNTGQAVATKANPCLLIFNSIVSGGGMFDSSLLPAGSSNSDSSNTSSGSFVAATYNLLNGDLHAEDSINIAGGCDTAQDRACIKKRTALQAKIISGQAGNPAFDLIGTEETSPTQFKTIMSDLPANYAAVPDTDKDIRRLTQEQNGATAIIWNTTIFTKFSEGKYDAISNVANAAQNPGGHITSPWVGLEMAGGQHVYVTTIHYPNDHFYDPKLGDAGTIKEASKQTMAWVKSIEQSDPGSIVMVMGDFNDMPGQKLSYCAYTQPGLMQNTYDMATGKSANNPCPSADGSHPGFAIDQVYATPLNGLTATGWTHISDNNPTAKHASDHTPVYVTMNLPGSATAAGNGTTGSTGSSFVGNDGFSGGSCVAYVEYILKRHSSSYHGGKLGDGKDVANSLAKYGYAINNSPAIHAVVSFPTSLADPTYGHTAIVAQLNNDGSIVVEESNWSNQNTYGKHTVPASEVSKLTYAHTEAGWH